MSWITEKFNSFHIARVDAENKKNKMFLPTDVMCNTVKHHKTKINSYFSTQKYFAYRSFYGVIKSNEINHRRAWKSHYFSNYYDRVGK